MSATSIYHFEFDHKAHVKINDLCDRGTRNLYFIKNVFTGRIKRLHKRKTRAESQVRYWQEAVRECEKEFTEIEQEQSFLEQQERDYHEMKIENTRLIELHSKEKQVYYTLRQACEYAGLKYNTVKDNPSKQPNGGKADRKVGPKRQWKHETITAWITGFNTCLLYTSDAADE